MSSRRVLSSDTSGDDRWALFLPPCHPRNHWSEVAHRTNTYLNNRLEQDHCGMKQRYYPMHGFKNFEATARFCCAFDELRDYFRPRRTMGEAISLPEQRRVVLQRLSALKALIQAVS